MSIVALIFGVAVAKLKKDLSLTSGVHKMVKYMLKILQ